MSKRSTDACLCVGGVSTSNDEGRYSKFRKLEALELGCDAEV